MTVNVIDKYFHKNSLVKHQIDSFNKFVRYDIAKIIEDTGNITCSVNENVCVIKFFNFSLDYINHVENDGTEINITPHECRLRNISYTAPMFIDISVNDHVFEKCDIGRLPIMVKSDYCLLQNIEKTKECENDPGGYFIVSGTEKVIVSQEKMNNNHVYVFEKKSNKIEFEAEIRSIKENETKSTSTIKAYILKINDGEYKLMVSLPFFKTDVPALYVYNMLNGNSKNFTNNYNINKANDLLFYSETDLSEELENTTVNEYFAKKCISKDKPMEEILNKYFLPHMKTNKRKCFMLGYMINKLIE